MLKMICPALNCSQDSMSTSIVFTPHPGRRKRALGIRNSDNLVYHYTDRSSFQLGKEFFGVHLMAYI